jgi:four helix bundle protein
MGKSVVMEKSFVFAIKIVNTYKEISVSKKEYVLSKQLLKSGTSIGANISEALSGQSDRDFYSKMNISSKEAHETLYWLQLLKETDYLTHDKATELINDCNELIRIINSILITTKAKL